MEKQALLSYISGLIGLVEYMSTQTGDRPSTLVADELDASIEAFIGKLDEEKGKDQ